MHTGQITGTNGWVLAVTVSQLIEQWSSACYFLTMCADQDVQHWRSHVQGLA